MLRHSLMTTLVTALVLLASVSPGRSAVITVDWAGSGGFLTVQQGIDAASPGDTVLILPGLYLEHLDMGSGSGGIALLGKAGPDSTEISGSGDGRVLLCEGLLYPVSVSGLTLSNGRINWGGGIKVTDSVLTLSDVCIKSCHSPAAPGGGLYSRDSEVYITDSMMLDNQGADGGGLHLHGGESLILRCYFEENRAQGFAGALYGGAIHAGPGTHSIKECTFVDNYAVDSGGAVALWGGSGHTLEGCQMVGNYAGYLGGAVIVREATAAVTGNVLSGSELHHLGTGGAAICVSSVPDSCLFVDNVVFGSIFAAGGAVHVSGGGPVRFTSNFLVNEACEYEATVGSGQSDTVDFRHNWWGTGSSAEIQQRIWDQADDPALDAYIDFGEWCTDESCSGAVTTVPEQQAVSWGYLKSMYR